MEENELSVQELSNKTGKSIQSIYKRIKNENLSKLSSGFCYNIHENYEQYRK